VINCEVVRTSDVSGCALSTSGRGFENVLCAFCPCFERFENGFAVWILPAQCDRSTCTLVALSSEFHLRCRNDDWISCKLHLC